MRDPSELRSRFVQVIVATLAASTGCKSEPPVSTTATTPVTSPRPAPLATGSASAVATCGEQPATQECFSPRTDLRAQGTGSVPAEGAPPSFDANGCMALEETYNGCCLAAVAGPRFDDEKCCYQFCPGPCCGRPFLVGSQARLAPLCERSDWGAASDARRQPASTSVAGAWLADARMEHASVAAFARLAVQLVVLGAPPSLVAACHAAAADEVAHARLCFELAHRFAPSPGSTMGIGPGCLEVDGAMAGNTIDDVAVGTFVEGCIGETVASLTASARLATATDGMVRDTLSRIAVDEAAHAELSWRVLVWALVQVPLARRGGLVSELWQRARAGSSEPPVQRGDASYGVLSSDQFRRIEHEAMQHVIQPALDTLTSLIARVGSNDVDSRDTQARPALSTPKRCSIRGEWRGSRRALARARTTTALRSSRANSRLRSRAARPRSPSSR
jgi:hypothetical protein